MPKENILIIGSNRRSLALAEELSGNQEYHIVGFADDVQREDHPAKYHQVDMPVERVCQLDDIEDYIRKNDIHQVLITLPVKGEYNRIAEILSFCEQKQIEARIVSELFDIDYHVVVEPPQRNTFRNKAIEISNNISLFLKKNRHPQERLVLIVGMRNLRALSLAESVRQKGSGYKFIGYVEENRNEILKGMSVVCDMEEFEDYISKNPVDEVIFSLPIKSFYNKIKLMIEQCREQGIVVKIVDDFFSRRDTIPKYINRDSQGILFDFRVKNISLLQYDFKWIVDRVVSFIFIVFALPVLLIIALAVFLDDGWPVVYNQERVGRNKRRFKMLKFRTMVKNAEKLQDELEARNEVDGAAFKITNDPRVTKLGKWLRKTSLDELPQLFNVLKADMSLVGPRPLPVRDFNKFYNNSHRRRFSLDPGITGPWQVSGRSDTIDFEDWMRLDLEYVDKWNIFLDFKILLQTIPAVLFCKGAK
jgi:exopolysaccharide biosynthesis polyprenyl glycosylphosphotransferase